MTDQASRVCTQCGTPLGPTARFCGNCGASVASATGGVAPPPEPPPQAGAAPTAVTPAAVVPPAAATVGAPPPDDGDVRISKRTMVIVGVCAVLALIAGALVLLNRGDDGDQTVAVGDEEGEIFLEPAASLGPGPFADEVLESEPIGASTSSTSTTVATTTTIAGTVTAVAAVEGGEPGLYGGTRNNARCDRDAMIRFLEADPVKAAAWVQALNSDPTLRWSGGTRYTSTRSATTSES